MTELSALQHDPKAFRAAVSIPAASGAVVPFGSVVEPWQQADFVVCAELCYWVKRDLFDSLLSTAAMRLSRH